MIPQQLRLRAQQDFETVFREGRRINGAYLTIHFMDGADSTRLTVVAGKRVSLQSTKRNRVKRQIRSALAEHIPALPSGTLLVINVKPEALGVSYQALVDDLHQAIKKMGT